MDNPSFSILVPHLGDMTYLIKCVDSLTNQSSNFSDVEILICDQSEEDVFKNNDNVLRSFKTDISINHFYYPVQNLYLARQALLEKAKKDYCVFVDSDDFLSKDFISLVSGEIQKNNYPDILVINLTKTNEKGEPFKKQNKYPRFISKHINDYFCCTNILNSACKKIFKRQLYKRNEFLSKQITLGEDYFFSKPLMENAQKIVFFSQQPNLYFYRQHESSIIHDFCLNDGIEILKLIFDKAPELPNSFQKKLLSKSVIANFVSIISVLKKKKDMSKNDFDEIEVFCKRHLLIKKIKVFTFFLPIKYWFVLICILLGWKRLLLELFKIKN